MAEQEPGPRGFWQRFSSQETGPQKVIVGLAGTMTAVATAVGGVYGVASLVRHDPPASSVADSSTTTSTTSSTTNPSTTPLASPSATTSASPSASPSAGPSAGVTTRPGQTLVTQGSKEADDLIHAFVDNPGRRVDLDVVIVADSHDKTPQWIMRLWYNCHDLPAGQPPGEDVCDSAMLVFDDQNPSPTRFDNPPRIELRGTWADNRPQGSGYGAKGLEIYPVQATF